jgi:hypothetical protein
VRCTRRLLLVIGVCLTPALAAAEWKSFMPTPAQNDLALDVFFSHERDNFGGLARPTDWTDAFAKERLTLYSHGYFYHPRFLRYRFALGGLLSQEKYQSLVFAPTGWNVRTGTEYDVALTLLPEHRYNLHLFASRFEPLFKEYVATSHNRVGKIAGARFQYEQRPYFLRAGLLRNTTDFGDFSTEVDRANTEAKYFKEMANGNELSFDLAFNPIWTSSSSGLTSTSYERYAANTLKLGRLRLTSSLTGLTWDQEHSSTGDGSSDQLAWQERLTVWLPWSFRSDVSYRYHDNESTFDAPVGALSRHLEDKGDDLQADLVHRLYESVDTTYSLLRDSRSSQLGNTTNLSQSLTINYNKNLRLGSLMLGASGQRGDLDSTGSSTSVVNEPHPGTPVPGIFTLGQENVVPGSVAVLLKSPVPPYELVTLVEGIHYSVFPVVAALEIRVYGLPPEFVVPGTYDFLASYSLAGGDFTLRNRSFSGSASLKLFRELLTTYAGYTSVNTDVVSGVFPGIPVDSKTYTAGVRLSDGPWRATGEYANLDWDFSPRVTWKGRLEYSSSSADSSTRLFGSAAYATSRYSRGDPRVQPTPFTEHVLSVSANAQKRLRSPRMSFSAGGTYSHLSRWVSADAFSWNAVWNWKIGRMEIDAGATAYRYLTAGSPTTQYDRNHHLYYVKLRRDLF